MMQNRKIWFVLVIFCWCMACGQPETSQKANSEPTKVTKTEQAQKETVQTESSVDKALREFAEGLYAKKLATRDWTQAQWIEFIQRLPLDTENKKMKELDLIFDINETQDQKLLSVWSEQSIKNGYFIETEEIIHPFMVKTDFGSS